MKDYIQLRKFPVKDMLKTLLTDKTTGKNITFATNSYADYGINFAEDSYITEREILGIAECEIQPRICKALEQQAIRTKNKAEVFTPSWICNRMNNFCDEEWFGEKNIFNGENGTKWTANPEKIRFVEKNTWQKYVDLRFLEITCGECPYLVSRYDTSTGDEIPISERIGILDRKLRVVSENTDNEEEWLKWVTRAYQSTYGYEYQGDSLLIARINLLMTFCDYMQDKWNRKPKISELNKIVNIISWNIFQMNGINGNLPIYGLDNYEQMTIFSLTEEEPQKEEIPCYIYNWRVKEKIKFNDTKEGKKMKFDFVIGNPPYQETVTDISNQAKPIYHLFVNEAQKVCKDKVVMIIPAKWYSGGMGLDDFRNQMINCQQISRLVDFPNAKECFPNVSIGGGVCYFLWDKNNNGECNFTNIENGKETTLVRLLNEYPILVRYNKAISIIRKTESIGQIFVKDIVSSVSPFGISTKVRGKENKDLTHTVRLFSSKGASYITADEVLKGDNYLKVYKVMLSQTGAEHAGEPSKDGCFNVLSSTMRVLEPLEVCTHSYLTIGKFDNANEPKNLIKYLKTKFVRFLVLQTISSIHITKGNFLFVPLQDFTAQSDIDWTKSVADIDRQLYQKYGLTQQEIDFIETKVKEMN